MLRTLSAAAAALLIATTAAAQTTPRPSLVVIITVDQLVPGYFTRWQGQLNGGLRRLYQGGAFFTNAWHDHGMTETAPGHASVLSGRFPRGTGIIRNSAGIQDPMYPVLGAPGAQPASPFRFRGSTLVDWIRLRDPGSRALSVSRKDRGAILPLGRSRQSSFWYALNGRFSTSTYYADTLPTWVREFNARRPVMSLAGRRWTLLLPDSAYSEPDSVAIERRGVDVVFPHVLPTDSAALVDLAMSTPWMDQVTLDLALAGVRAMKLGEGGITDLLAVSLSSTDAVGHQWGPDSRELHDQILRLDRALGVFLDSIFAMRGADRVIVALTSDHGIGRFPEVAHPADYATRYITRDPFNRWLLRELRALGMDSTAVEFDDGVLFYDRAAFAARRIDPTRLFREFVEFARRQDGVMRADLPGALVRDSATSDIARRWTHMFPPDVAVGAVVTQEPGNFWGRPGQVYAQHGSVHDYDAHVPVLFYGAPFRAGRYDVFARVVDIAPTLARVLGLEPTEPLDGRVLAEALR
jgi:predicted AlkP superfamily pyrophosphatase or phosphodiesterase